MKTHFTRKNFIAIGLVYFFLVMVLVAALALDTSAGIFVASNPIAQIAGAFSLPTIEGSVQFYILLLCVLIYILIFTCAFIYEFRLAEYYNENAFSKKWITVYGITLLVCLILAFGIGL